MRRATAVLVCLTLSGGLAALGTADPAPHKVRTVAGSLPGLETGLRGPSPDEAHRTFEVGEPSTTAVAPPTTTTTTEEPPTTAPPTTVRRTTTTMAPAAATVTAGPNGTADLAACVRHYESTDGVDPNLYQFEGPTWAAAFDAATAQGLIPVDTPYTSASAAARSVQDAAFWAWVNLGYLRSAWAAQRGRCF
jgi:hypothetical protein